MSENENSTPKYKELDWTPVLEMMKSDDQAFKSLLRLLGIPSPLRGSLYATYHCSYCGRKLVARALGSELNFRCPEQISPEQYYKNGGKSPHDDFCLNLTEIAAIINNNPLL